MIPPSRSRSATLMRIRPGRRSRPTARSRGASAVDESMLDRESVPVDKTSAPGSGQRSHQRRLTVGPPRWAPTPIGADRRAGGPRPAARAGARLADRFPRSSCPPSSRSRRPLRGWWLLGGTGQGLIAAVAVLIVACRGTRAGHPGRIMAAPGAAPTGHPDQGCGVLERTPRSPRWCSTDRHPDQGRHGADDTVLDPCPTHDRCGDAAALGRSGSRPTVSTDRPASHPRLATPMGRPAAVSGV